MICVEVGFNRVKMPFDTTFARISSYDSARTISRATVPFPCVTSVAKRVPKSSGNGALIITKSYWFQISPFCGSYVRNEFNRIIVGWGKQSGHGCIEFFCCRNDQYAVIAIPKDHNVPLPSKMIKFAQRLQKYSIKDKGRWSRTKELSKARFLASARDRGSVL